MSGGPSAWFDRWARLWAGQEAPWSLAALRIGVGLVLLWDFLTVIQLGLVQVLWAPYEAGGLVEILQRTTLPPIYEVLPGTAFTPWLLVSLMVLGAVALTLGLWTRAAALLLVLVSAQLALITPNTDRGIDMMLRNVLMVLVFSGSGAAWSVESWWRRRAGGPAEVLVAAWPRRLLLLQVVVMYFAAGVQKIGSVWLPVGDFSAIYVVLHDPMLARFSPETAGQFYWLTQLGTVGTMVFEWGAPMILLYHWFRHTRTRPGWLRAWFNRWEVGRWFVLIGLSLHIGIAASMNIGIFPWAMLALYPVFFHPDEVRALSGRQIR